MTTPTSGLPLVVLDTLIRDVVAVIDTAGKGIALVVNAEQHLVGTITDGDVRRALLAGQDLGAPASVLLSHKAASPYPLPVTAPARAEPSDLLRLMQERQVRQVPLLDAEQRVVGLVTADDLLPNLLLPVQAMIMAGGFGTRLAPLTEDLPKPMLPIGDRPLMERMVDQMRQAGIRRVHIATHYMGEKIVEHFGDGRDFGMQVSYISEERPMGTAGALGLMPAPLEPLLVLNGDILTRVDFRAMLAYHQEHQAALTVAVRKYEQNVPFGVVESDGPFVRALVEKPLSSFFVNAGIYLLEPAVHRYIVSGEHLDMPDLIQRLLAARQTVVSFPVLEYWLDIGQPADYRQAQADMKDGTFQA